MPAFLLFDYQLLRNNIRDHTLGLDGARDAYAKAAELAPHYSEYLIRHGLILVTQEDLNTAKKVLATRSPASATARSAAT